jgi:hypothetical protein
VLAGGDVAGISERPQRASIDAPRIGQTIDQVGKFSPDDRALVADRLTMEWRAIR